MHHSEVVLIQAIDEDPYVVQDAGEQRQLVGLLTAAQSTTEACVAGRGRQREP